MIADLQPRDSLEYEQARRIAIYYLRLRRLSRLEAEDLARHTTTRPQPADELLFDLAGPADPDESRERAAGQALEWSLRSASTIDARTAQAIDRALLVYGELQKRSVPTDPEGTDGHEPIDVEAT